MFCAHHARQALVTGPTSNFSEIVRRAAEAYLEGRAITPEAIAEAGRIAVSEAHPISDFRASADYRRDLIAVLIRRALANAYARAKAKREGERR